MDEPVTGGLILGVAVSVAGLWLSRRTATDVEVFLPKLGVSSLAAIGTLPVVLTPLLILLVAVMDDNRDSGAIVALMVCAAIVTLVGWPLAFVVARKSIARARSKAQQVPRS
jgi:hypothetical protein